VLPAHFNTGLVYSPRLRATAEPEAGPTTHWLTGLAQALDVLIGGAILIRDGGRLFNTFLLAEPGGAVHRYRQQHPWLWEHCFFEAGRQPGLAATRLGRLGLLAGWDVAHGPAWEALRGQADLVLVSSAPPRLHRAVLNFPEARKVYAAELLPELLAARADIDDWYLGGPGGGAAYAGVPVISAVMAGRFVSAIPYARLCFGLAALGRPRYAGWVSKANQATLRATFYGTSAAFGPDGRKLAGVTAEEGWAAAEMAAGGQPRGAQAAPRRDGEAGSRPARSAKPASRGDDRPADRLLSLPRAPIRLQRLDNLLRALGGRSRRDKPDQS
jgi:predicted amidohydrolase